VAFAGVEGAGEVGKTGAAGLPGSRHLELRTAGIGVGFVPLEVIAPGFDEEALDEGGLGGAFREGVAGSPRTQAGEECGGLRAGLEGLELGAPLGTQKGIVKQGK